MSVGIFFPCVGPVVGGTAKVARMLFCAGMLVLMTDPSRAVTLAAGGGAGWPTAMGRYLDTSPAVEVNAFVPLTEKVTVGVLSDYAHLQTKTPETTARQQRILAVVRWKVSAMWLPARVQPFAQIGIGAGTMEYSGSSLSERLNAPASRIGIGTSIRMGKRASLETTLSYDRLEAASIQAERKYPTMMSVRCAFALAAFGSKPLLPHDR